jgi:hypothetical protein
LEVIEILNENQYITAHPPEVIILLMKRVAPSRMAMVGNLTADGLQQKKPNRFNPEGIKL